MASLLSRSILVPALYAMLAVVPLFFVSVQAVHLQADLHFGESRLGLAIGLGFAASGVAAVGAGHVVERLGPSTGLRCAALLAGAALTWLSVGASSWLGVAVTLGLGGVANVVAQISMNLALTPDVPRARQALAFGLKQASMPAAALLCGILVPPVAAVFGWRAVALIAAAATAVAAGYDPRLVGSRSERRAAVWRPDRRLGAAAAAGLLAGAVAAGLPAFAVDAAAERGMSAATAGAFLAVGSSVALAIRILAGWAVDRHGGHGLTEFAAIVAAAACSFLVLSVTRWDTVFALGIVLTMGFGYGSAGVLQLATIRLHPSTPGAATGLLLSAVAVGNVVGPMSLGFVVEHGSYRAAWAAAAGVALLSAGAAIIARRWHIAAVGVRPRT